MFFPTASRLFKEADKLDNQRDNLATQKNAYDVLHDSGYSLNDDQLGQTNRMLQWYDNEALDKGIDETEFKTVFDFVQTADIFNTADTKAMDNPSGTEGEPDGVLRNPTLIYNTVINHPDVKRKLNAEQKEDIFNLIMVVHFNNGLTLNEFNDISTVAKEMASGKDMASSETYMKTFFTALDEHDSGGKADGKITDGNAPLKELKNYSIFQEQLTPEKWLVLSDMIKEKETDKIITSDEFKEIFNQAIALKDGNKDVPLKDSLELLRSAKDIETLFPNENDTIDTPKIIYTSVMSAVAKQGGKLDDAQKEDISNLITLMLSHHGSVTKEEFENILSIAKDAANGVDISSNETYMKTFFTALDEHDSGGKADGKFANGNTLWGELRNYSSLQGDLTMNEWFLLYKNIDTLQATETEGVKKPVTYDMFKEILKKGNNYAGGLFDRTKTDDSGGLFGSIFDKTKDK